MAAPTKALQAQSHVFNGTDQPFWGHKQTCSQFGSFLVAPLGIAGRVKFITMGHVLFIQKCHRSFRGACRAPQLPMQNILFQAIQGVWVHAPQGIFKIHLDFLASGEFWQPNFNEQKYQQNFKKDQVFNVELRTTCSTHILFEIFAGFPLEVANGYIIFLIIPN